MRSTEPLIESGMRPRGFTLIEVLAALVIVTLGMLGAIQAVTQAAGNGSYLRDKTLAHWIAMNRLSETRLAAQPPSLTDDASGELDYANQHWRWTLKASKTTVASMLRIDVSVAQADAPQKSALATVTGFYGTAIAPPQQSPMIFGPGQQPGQPGSPQTPPGSTPTAPVPPPATSPPPAGGGLSPTNTE